MCSLAGIYPIVSNGLPIYPFHDDGISHFSSLPHPSLRRGSIITYVIRACNMLFVHLEGLMHLLVNNRLILHHMFGCLISIRSLIDRAPS